MNNLSIELYRMILSTIRQFSGINATLEDWFPQPQLVPVRVRRMRFDNATLAIPPTSV